MADIKDIQNHKWAVGEIVKLKKPHPCGGWEWEIVKVGLDFRLRCLGCNHYLLMPRTDFLKRVKALVEKAQVETSEK